LGNAKGLAVSIPERLADARDAGSISDLRVSEISAASPDMNAPEFQALVEDIRAHGQLVPIWKSGDEIIDGRKRLRACSIIGIPPNVVDVSPDQDATTVAYSLNILRTHYTSSQRAMFAAKRANWPRPGPGRANTIFSVNGSMKTESQAAAESGVSTSYVIAAKHVRREGAAEVVAAVETGKLTLHAAEQIVRRPRGEQPDIAEKVIQSSIGKSRHTSTACILGKPNGFKRSPTRPLPWKMERALDQLDNAIDALAHNLEERGAHSHADFQEWIGRLTSARGSLAKIIGEHRRTA